MSNITLKSLGLSSLLLASAVTLSNPALAVDEYNVAPGLTAAGAPLGLHGVDPVASVQVGSPIEGQASYTAIYKDVAYYFTSQANMDTFAAAPQNFVPQNGGFCTFGVSVGKKFDGDPNFASVVDGKLYVFLNEDIYKLYLKDKAGTISKAEQQWQKIEHLASTAL